jgi:thiamine kinase-like enzyme
MKFLFFTFAITFYNYSLIIKNTTFTSEKRKNAVVDSIIKPLTYLEKINDTIFSVEFENNMFMRLKINGNIVHPNDHKKYQHIITKAEQNFNTLEEQPFYSKQEFNMNQIPKNLDSWEIKFKEELERDGLVDLKKSYKIQFGDLALRINGRDVEKRIHEKYLSQYKQITGVNISGGYTLTDK